MKSRYLRCPHCRRLRIFTGPGCDACLWEGRTIRIAKRPTDAQPGSEDKIRIMAERYARGEAVFHPLDAHLWHGTLE